MNQWDAQLYDSKHSFVSRYGADVIALLAPQPGERILDLGCGTGHLTYQIAGANVDVVGLDSAASMIEQAKANYPDLHFELGDATGLHFTEEFDAVFSNAVLHWINQPAKVISGVWRALKPGGRFVAEFGGKGNVQAIAQAIHHALVVSGYASDEPFNPWYFPSIAEYGTLLEQQGFQLTYATLFDRLTPMTEGDKGMQNWIAMFASNLLASVPVDQRASVLTKIEDNLRSKLYQDGTWFIDYRRLRVLAIKPKY
jgi:trans-aconitate methyltransferase